MPEVEMTPVRSSNITSIGYDEAARELRVTFHSGATYAYEGVDRVAYDDMLAAGSPGSYLNRWIKGRHSDRRIG